MNQLLKSMLLMLLTLISTHSYGQLQGQPLIDSLLKELPHQKEDTVKATILRFLAANYARINPDEGIKYGQQALELSTKLGWKLGIARTYNNLGLNYTAKKDYSKALECGLNALRLSEEIGDKKGITIVTGGILDVYSGLNDYPKALEYCFKFLKLQEEMGNRQMITSIYSQIAGLYISQRDFPNAMEFYFKAFKLGEEIGDKKWVASITADIGAAYYGQSDYPKALEYLFNALKLSEEGGYKIYMAKVASSISMVYRGQGAFPKALEYDLRSLKIYEELGDKKGIAAGTSNIGLVYSSQRDYPKALEYYLRALELDEKWGFKTYAANVTGNIGLIYEEQGDNPKALEYDLRVLKLNEELGNKLGVAAATGNIGNIYARQGQHILASEYLHKCLKVSEEIGDKPGVASALHNIGCSYLKIIRDTGVKDANVYVSARQPDSRDKPAVSIPIGKEALISGAIDYEQRAILIGKEINKLDLLQACYAGLSEAYQLKGDYKQAIEYKEIYHVMKDSIYSAANDKKIMQQGMQYDYEKKEAIAKADFFHQQDSLKLENERKELDMKKEMELSALKFEYEKKQAAAKTDKERRDLAYEEEMKRNKIAFDYEQKRLAMVAQQKQNALIAKAEQEKRDTLALQKLQRQRTYSYVGGGVAILLLCFSFFIVKERGKSERERKRSDGLLLNILPAEVAEELKAKGSAEAKLIDDVTVLFTDFKGFTQLSEKLTAKELVGEINTCFSAFDNIMHKHGVEKIKTIGDAYMAAGGLPTPNKTHAMDVVKAALEIQDFMHRHREEREAAGKLFFEIRIGVHTGPVVAGIVGIKKFAYDIWGDTVNTASRMESSGTVGKVNISETTYELVKDKFNCEYRGEVEAKGKGVMKMYYVG